MIFFVSSYETTGALEFATEFQWFNNVTSAKEKARELADLTKNTHFVYKFEQYDCIEPILPKKKFKVYFKSVEYNPVCITTVVDVQIQAVDESEAFDEAVHIMQGKGYQYDGIEEVKDDTKK